MATTPGTRVQMQFPEVVRIPLTAGDGVDTDIPHGLGRIPIAAWISNTAVPGLCCIVSMDRTNVKVNVANGSSAELFIVRGAG